MPRESILKPFNLTEEMAELVREEPDAATRAKWDRKAEEMIRGLEDRPEKAEKGKAFVILWAEGRAIYALRNKKDAIQFIRDKQKDDDVCWVHYAKPKTKAGTTIRVHNSYKSMKESMSILKRRALTEADEDLQSLERALRSGDTTVAPRLAQALI